LQGADRPVAGSVQGSHVDVASQVGDEHAVVTRIKSDANAFHQVGRHNLRFGVENAVQRCPVDGVAVRRIATVGLVQRPRGVVDFEVDRFGQVLEDHIDVAAVVAGFACGNVDPSPQDPSESVIPKSANFIFAVIGSTRHIPVATMCSCIDPYLAVILRERWSNSVLCPQRLVTRHALRRHLVNARKIRVACSSVQLMNLHLR
jgi:hypothetical protein